MLQNIINYGIYVDICLILNEKFHVKIGMNENQTIRGLGRLTCFCNPVSWKMINTINIIKPGIFCLENFNFIEMYFVI